MDRSTYMPASDNVYDIHIIGLEDTELYINSL